jgi:hypothetical protein
MRKAMEPKPTLALKHYAREPCKLVGWLYYAHYLYSGSKYKCPRAHTQELLLEHDLISTFATLQTLKMSNE